MGATTQFDTHRQLRQQAIANISAYPEDKFTKRGIVICGGGRKYFPNVWVLVCELRRLACHLPIEIWYLGEREWSPRMKSLLEPYDVTFMDATLVRKENPVRILNGWELKPYSIIHSGFQEVLLLDADNLPVRDPSYLFDTPEYQTYHAIFWPDFGRLGADREIWNIMGLAYQDEPEFESGQILVNKSKCWGGLALTMHLNEYSDFYYQHIHGDKETFHLAWKALDLSYAMPKRGIEHLDCCTMCQHDFLGERIFQHRNMAKWSLSQNRTVKDFWNENHCIEHISKLRALWDDWVFEPAQSPIETDKVWYEQIAEQGHFLVSSSNRLSSIKFDRSGQAWDISGHVLFKWDVVNGILRLGNNDGGVMQFSIRAGDGPSSEMTFEGSPSSNIAPVTKEDRELAEETSDGRRFIYIRQGIGERPMQFLWDGAIGEGSARCERQWAISQQMLYIGGEEGVIAKLKRNTEGEWEGSWEKFERCNILLRPEEKRKVIVIGLEKAGGALVESFFRECFGAKVYRNPPSDCKNPPELQSDNLQGGKAFIVMCVRNPFDWLVALYKESEYSPQAAPTVSKHHFRRFLRSTHLSWPTPVHRWNHENTLCFSTIYKCPASSVILKLEDLQGTALQSGSLSRLALSYNPSSTFFKKHKAFFSKIPDSIKSHPELSCIPHFFERHYLEWYTTDSINDVNNILDKELCTRLGYLH